MRYQRDGFSVEAALHKGRQLPEWYLDEPPDRPLDDFYMRSFWDLNSTRRYEQGPVPWDTIVKYGYHAGLDDEIIEAFVVIIRTMDVGYLEWISTEADRQRDQRT